LPLRHSLKDCLVCGLTVLLVATAAAVLFGAVWGVVDWLRNFGSGLNPFPYFDKAQIQAQPYRIHPAGSLLGSIDDLINWYNVVFRGATRFGSGLGLIAGAFMAMGCASSKAAVCRITTGLLAGGLIGSRSVLMLGSGAPLFLIGLVLGAVLTALYMWICAGPQKIRELPFIPLSNP
jgi:hypothetical protein